MNTVGIMSKRGPYRKYLNKEYKNIPYSKRKRLTKQIKVYILYMSSKYYILNFKYLYLFAFNLKTDDSSQISIDNSIHSNDICLSDDIFSSSESSVDDTVEISSSTSSDSITQNICSKEVLSISENDVNCIDSDFEAVENINLPDLNEYEDKIVDSESEEEFENDVDEEWEEESGEENGANYSSSSLLHPALKTTKLEAQQMILSYFMRHKLSFVALEQLLILVNSLLQHETLPTTKHSFFKSFVNQYVPEYHFYCPGTDCGNALITCKDRSVKRNIICDVCNLETMVQSSSENYFVTLPLAEQLKEVIKENSEDFINTNSINNSSTSAMKDIKDGKIYKNYLEVNNNGRKKVTLVMNTDGVQVFNSKNKGLWPIQVIINELKVSKRFLIKNIVVLGLFYDPIHPKMHSLLNPFVMELRELNKSGNILILLILHFFVILYIYLMFYTGLSIEIDNVIHVFDVALICGTFDAPAKATVQNIMQHNGFCSCHYCMHPGETVDSRVKYPIRDNVQIRNHDQVLVDMKEAHISDRIINGFKGFSVLALAPSFNLVSGFAIDTMHADFLGLGRQFTAFFFDSNNNKFDYYIGRQVHEVNENILKIKLSCETDRNPRLLNERKCWKANEWRNWLLHYSVGVLYSILPEKYLFNYCRFVTLISILYQSEVTEDDITICEGLISSFRKEFQQFYGKESMTYNCHTTSHLPECVKNLGPLWNYSNFPFESNNGVLGKYVKSPKGVLQQILNKYNAFRYLQNKKKFTEVVCNFISKCSSSSVNLKIDRVLGNGIFVNWENINDNNFHQIPFSTNEFFVFKRFVWNEQLYSTKEYSQKIKTNDSAIKLCDDSYGEIVKIFKSNDNDIYIMVDLLCIDSDHVIGTLCPNYAVVDPHTVVRTVIVPINFIKCKCILIDLKNIKYFSEWIHFYDHC